MLRDEPSIARTLRCAETAAQPAAFETSRLLSEFPAGAIVVAPSGYGKTTLSRTVFRQAIEERWRRHREPLPFDVSLPNLEQSAVSLVAFMLQRLSARHPGVTPASLATTLRDIGAT
jgi:hypothetical protein